MKSFSRKEIQTSLAEAEEPFVIINNELPFTEQLSGSGPGGQSCTCLFLSLGEPARQMLKRKLKLQ